MWTPSNLPQPFLSDNPRKPCPQAHSPRLFGWRYPSGADLPIRGIAEVAMSWNQSVFWFLDNATCSALTSLIINSEERKATSMATVSCVYNQTEEAYTSLSFATTTRSQQPGHPCSERTARARKTSPISNLVCFGASVWLFVHGGDKWWLGKWETSTDCVGAISA